MDHTSEYHCNICGKTFEEFFIFEGHFTFNIKCRALGPCLQCYICGETFFHFAVLKYHLQRHSSNNDIRKIKSTSKNQDDVRPAEVFDCSVCERSFRKKFHLMEHLTIHSEADTTFQIQNALNESPEETNSQNVNPTNENLNKEYQTDAYNCNICARSFRTNFHLINHLKLHSQVDTKSSKKINGWNKENFLRKKVDRFSSNQRNKSSKESKRQGARKDYRCRVCNGNCYNKGQLERHKTIHMHGSVKCELCNIRFTKISLVTHNRQVHQISNYLVCKFCNQIFSHRPNLAVHLKVHSTGTVKCAICGIRFTQHTLARHNRLAHPELLRVQTISKAIKKATTATDLQTKTANSYHSLRYPKSASTEYKGKLHQCNICKAKFTNYKNMLRHMKIHSTGTVKCFICKIRFTPYTLSQHISLAHPELRPPTSKVIEKATTVPDLQTKTPNSYRSLRYPKAPPKECKSELHECNICKAKFTQYTNMMRHLMVHTIGKLECQVCKVKFTKHALEQHQKLFHPELIKHTVSNGVGQAKKLPTATTKANLYHSLRYPKAHSKECRDESHQCNICKAKFTQYTNMMRHMKMHFTGTGKCLICKIRFTPYSLSQHNSLVHPELVPVPTTSEEIKKAATVSELQNKTTNSYRSLSYTKAIECKGELHQCNICKAKFTLYKNMMRHLMVHTLGKLECQICKIKFTKRALDQHQKLFHPELINHTVSNGVGQAAKELQNASANEIVSRSESDEIISYQCKICTSSYFSEERLEHHVKCHSGAYRCEVCNIPFTKQTLWRHLNQAHPTFRKPKILKLSCSICIMNCSTLQQLEEHMKVHKEDDFYNEDRSNPYMSLEDDIAYITEEIPIEQYPDSVHAATSEEQDETIEKDVDAEFEVDRIISHQKLDDKIIYLVRWTGFGPEDDTWEVSSAFVKCKNILEEYCDKITNNYYIENNKNKDTVNQQHPPNVTLSNWNPLELQEILENQPLVLVENLLNEVSHLDLQNNTERKENYENVNMSSDPECNFIERDRYELKLKDDVDIVIEGYEENPYCNFQNSNEDADHSMNNSVRFFDCDLVEDVTTEEFEEQQNADEEVHRGIEDIVDEPVVDISSDSDDEIANVHDEFAEPHYCYFCEKVFYSLHDLRKHIKMCSTSD